MEDVQDELPDGAEQRAPAMAPDPASQPEPPGPAGGARRADDERCALAYKAAMRALTLAITVVVLPLTVAACGSSDEASAPPPQQGADASSDGTGEEAGVDASEEPFEAPDSPSEDGETEGATAESGPEGGTAEAAIAAYANALCGSFASCAPFLLGYLYGDLQSCIERYVAGGRSVLLPDGPGVVRTSEDLVACASAISSLTCEQLYAGQRDVACPAIPGSLAEGASCFSNLQCASGFCDRIGDCGACAARATVGAACEVANPGCGAGLVCDSPTMADPTTCMQQASEGQSCGSGVMCVGNLYCDSGVCAQPGGEGDSCTSADNACNGLLGLRCQGSPPTCGPVAAFADEGEPCGIVGSSYVPCLGTFYCDDSTEVCVAKLADGAGCEAGTTNPCSYYASCVDGLCEVDEEATCP